MSEITTDMAGASPAAAFETSQRAMIGMLAHVKRQIDIHNALLRDYKRLEDTLTDLTNVNYVSNVLEFEQIKRNLTPEQRYKQHTAIVADAIARDLDEQ